MNRIAVLILLLLTACVAAAAQSARRMVVWGGDPNCGFRSRAFEASDVITCSTVATERGPVNTISVNGLGLTVAFLEDEKFEIVAARITNKGMTPIMFDADNWGAAHFKSLQDFSKGEKPILAETSLPTRDLIRASSSEVLMTNAAENFVAESQLTHEVREVRRPDGTRQRRTVVVPDKAAREAASDRGQMRSSAMAGEMTRIRSTALTTKTVPAEGFVKGLVYFRKARKAGLIIFSLTVDGTNFVFRLPRDKK